MDIVKNNAVKLNLKETITQVTNFLLDSGADVSLIKISQLKDFTKYNKDIIYKLKGITDSIIETLGSIQLTILLKTRIILFNFHVVPDSFPLSVDGIIGRDFLQYYKANINYSNNYLTVCNESIPMFTPQRYQPIILQPRTETVCKIIINNSQSNNNYEAICEKTELKPNVYLPSALLHCNEFISYAAIVNLNEEPVEILNPISVNIEPFNYQTNHNVSDTISSSTPAKASIFIAEDFSSNRIKVLDEHLRTDHLNEEEKQVLYSICHKYNDVFLLPNDKLTSTKIIKHKIVTTNDFPIYTKPYRIPECHKEEINKQVKEMEEQGIVVPSESPYNTPLLVVPKKMDASGEIKWRVVCDFRKLNEATVDDKFPLPNISEILDQLGNSKYFSTLDLASSFHQIELEPNTAEKTAFSTSLGHYHFTRMPFGLKNAPATLQRLMNSILLGIQSIRAFAYLDDIVIYADTLESHSSKLSEILERLRQSNLKIQPHKCEFLRKEVLYLGHLITDKGIYPDPKKVKVLQEYPVPTTTKQLKSFIAFASYYRKFIPNFSKISQKLTELLKKNKQFIWTSEQQFAFENLRNILTNPPLLQYPDFTKDFIITTDASEYAIGAVLSQGEIGKDLPISYASRMLNKSEKNYSVTEKELLSIVWALKYYRPYVFGRNVKICTDHQPLKWLFSISDPGSRLTRWRIKLSEYNYEIIYKSGKTNKNADFLSRIQVPENITYDSKYEAKANVHILSPELQSYEDFLEYQRKNIIINSRIKESEKDIFEFSTENKIKHLACFVNESFEVKDQFKYFSNKFNDVDKIKQMHSENSSNIVITVKHSFYNIYYILYKEENNKISATDLFDKIKLLKQFLLKDKIEILCVAEFYNKRVNAEFRSILRYLFKDSNIQIVICKKFIEFIEDAEVIHKIIKEMHETPFSGHPGVTRTYKRIKEKYSWNNMKKTIKAYIRKCNSCQTKKLTRKKTKVPMEITTTSQEPFEKIFLDIVGPLPLSEDGMKYILTCQDDLSKFSISVALPNQEAKTVAKALIDNVICIYGIPYSILTDKGTNFMSSVFQDICKLFKIKKLNTTAYHPQSNGALERSHQTLEDFLKHFIKPNQTDWPEWIQLATFSYNTTPHTATKFTPFEIIFGKKANLPSSITQTPKFLYTYDDYMENIKMKLQTTRKHAYDNLLKSKENYKKNYDNKIIVFEFQPNDEVLLLDESNPKRGQSKKLSADWKGPYKVLQRVSNTNYLIQFGRRQIQVHVNKLKPYYS